MRLYWTQGKKISYYTVEDCLACLSVIVLEHDIHEQTVDLAIGYYLPAILGNTPPLKVSKELINIVEIADPAISMQLKSIGACLKWPAGNMYLESNTNATFPHATSTANSLGSTGNSTVASSNKAPGPTAVSVASSATSLGFLVPAFGTIFVSVLAVMGGTMV
jgi:hypothetical protein